MLSCSTSRATSAADTVKRGAGSSSASRTRQLADLVKRSKRWFHRIYPDARFIKSGPDGYKWEWPDGEELVVPIPRIGG